VYARRRNIVTRADGRLVNVARPRGQLFVCATGCCCGRTQDGWPAVPTELYHQEWERRRLRNVVHLTIGGCLGPCALANVVLLLFDGQALWFHSMDSEAVVPSLYDAIEAMLDGDVCVPLSPELARRQFTASAWQPRPDGQPVDDFRPRRAPAPLSAPDACASTAAFVDEDDADVRLHRLLAELEGATTVPRTNGELVFEAPWQGRVFAMAVALSEQGLFPWEEFRQALIVEVAAAEARCGEFRYYEAWLAAFEKVLIGRRIVSPAEVEENAYQFEFGERDDIF
jgi:nitrile hydratase accessory protein